MEMKITVDREKCSGHARCAMKGPDIYELDDEGYCISDGKVVTDESLRTQVIHGMKACPERAISVSEA